MRLSRPQFMASFVAACFFFLLFWFRLADVYGSHFFERGAIMLPYQLARVLYVPYLVWLQYAAGAGVLYRLGGRAFPFVGLHHFIASFLLGTSLWHMVLFALGLAGLLLYPVMLLLAGGVMLASVPHMARLIAAKNVSYLWKWDERMALAFAAIAMLLFLFIKGAYPSGGHDFFNHYFTYYKEVVDSGNLGPHTTWYQFYYSKGLGLYFMSMILLDPFAVHLVGMTFVILSACIVYDLLKSPDGSRLLPLFGVAAYLMFYITTAGRGSFAANGGWGDLEKTHELTATLLLGCVWLMGRVIATKSHYHAVTLYAVCVCNVIIGFASGLVAGSFFLGALLWRAVVKDWYGARVAFKAGVVTAGAMLLMLAINYCFTGLPLDQLADRLWPLINFHKVAKIGYTLELYTHFYDMVHYSKNELPLLETLPKMLIEYYRLYMLWPVALIGALLYASRLKRVKLNQGGVLVCFVVSSYLFATFFGGRSQYISFFRFSTFNYAPTLVLCLLLWQAARPPLQRVAVIASVTGALACYVFGAFSSPNDPGMVGRMANKADQWKLLMRAAYRLNSGAYSLRDAVIDQWGRQARLKWGGINPSLEKIQSGFPPDTRIWSISNHAYCLIPHCNSQQFFSQVTLKRWYDVALGSVEEGKKIMQEEGLNFIFYSRSIPIVYAADAKDQLAGFYKGLFPENIAKTYGILWTDGWDYLLTWKEDSVAPLDENFMDSWKLYYKDFVLPRQEKFPTRKLAVMVKKAIDEHARFAPVPDWGAQ